jgi:membrane protease YdiL (CAAX protease family)
MPPPGEPSSDVLDLLPPADEAPAVPPPFRPARPPHPGLLTGVLWCLLFLIVTQVLPGIVVLLGVAFVLVLSAGGFHAGVTHLLQPAGTEEWIRRSMMPSVALSQTLAVFFSWFVLRLVIGPSWARQLSLRRPRVFHLVLTVLALPAVVVLAAAAYALAKDYLPSLTDLMRIFLPVDGKEQLPAMEEMVKLFGTWPLGIAVLFIGVGPGIGEELWCRGFLGRGLVGRYGVVGGVLLTSLLFGAIHVDPRQGAMATLMGLVLHYLYLTTRSLWTPILLHILNNSFAVTVAHFGGQLEKLDQTPEDIPLVIYLGAGVLLVAIALALYQTRARLAGADGGPPPWQPPYPGVAEPPPGCGTVVVEPRMTQETWLTVASGIAVFAAACYAGIAGIGAR